MSTRYSRDHEWIRQEGDDVVIGITAYAQEQLGDVVYVELPEVGKTFAKGAEAAVVESVKAASEVYAPISGEVLDVNNALADEPATVNQSPEAAGWFFRMKPADKAEIEALMDADAYKAFLETI